MSFWGLLVAFYGRPTHNTNYVYYHAQQNIICQVLFPLGVGGFFYSVARSMIQQL